MQKIVLASNNKHKIREFKEMLEEVDILTLEDVGFYDDIEETGETFYENAFIKAVTVFNFLKMKKINAIVIADDSGLCVNALGGRPGIYSARYAGNHDFKAARKKLLEELDGQKDRSAYCVCVLVSILPNGKIISAEGKTYGHITEKECGSNGFAFDCLFFSDDLGKTYGIATDEEKNSISHRGRALRILKQELEQLSKQK